MSLGGEHQIFGQQEKPEYPPSNQNLNVSRSQNLPQTLKLLSPQLQSIKSGPENAHFTHQRKSSNPSMRNPMYSDYDYTTNMRQSDGQLQSKNTSTKNLIRADVLNQSLPEYAHPKDTLDNFKEQRQANFNGQPSLAHPSHQNTRYQPRGDYLPKPTQNTALDIGRSNVHQDRFSKDACNFYGISGSESEY